MHKEDVIYNKKNLLEMIFHKNKTIFHQDDLLAIYMNFRLSSSNCLGFSGSKSFSIIKDLNLLFLPLLDLIIFSSIEFSKF